MGNIFKKNYIEFTKFITESTVNKIAISKKFLL